MAKKLITCKACGAEIAPNAKVCPKCGAKNKKPVYKKWWFYAVIVIVILMIIGGSEDTQSAGNSLPASGGTPTATDTPKESDMPVAQEPEPEPEPEPISYAQHDVTELFAALKDNALKAERTYQDQYVELYGFLANIDSDGKYISVGAAEDNWEYMFDTVHCTIKSEAQLDQVIELSTGDSITVRGKITDIGELLGYMLDIDSIN